jgi:isopentenyldiphosphate isomerase
MIDRSELLFVVDEDNNPIAPKSRRETHQKKYWHRTADIWIFNACGQVLSQKRSLAKDFNPGMWEAFFGGHLSPGEDYETGARKELSEELGISPLPKELRFFKVARYEPYNEFRGVFVLLWDGEVETLKIEKEEIDTIKWLDLEDLKKALKSNDGNWTPTGYEEELFSYVEKENLL